MEESIRARNMVFVTLLILSQRGRLLKGVCVVVMIRLQPFVQVLLLFCPSSACVEREREQKPQANQIY